jgi:hypothetical protein
MGEIIFIERWNESTSIRWWNECRKIANKAIDAYNRLILGDEDLTLKKAFLEFKMSYLNLKNESVDYSVDFDTMAKYYTDQGLDVSFYHGW